VLNGISSGFAFGYVIGKVYVAGDAATTARNVAAHSGLVRISRQRLESTPPRFDP
jgi:hypothetical protein